MPVNLKITLGTVNYLNWLHVTAAKVSSPTSISWETWIKVPVSNYNFIIPNLDPENYYVSYYDADTNTSLGSLVAQLVVNALTGDTLYERRFYTCGGVNPGDPPDGASSIADPYLINKNVTGVFKEGFRYYDPATEFSFDNTTGTVTVLNGTTFSANEKFIVEIQYDVASTGGPAAGNSLYSSTINVTEATRTLLSSEINARIRCVGTASTQVITLPSLASIAIDNGFYFDNTVGGTAVQVKLLTAGSDMIHFNGFMIASDFFNEFWVSRGEHLLLRKFDNNSWEVITDYKGVNVGERVSLLYKSHPNILIENGALIDGDEYPRLWWWIKNILPATHFYITDTVVTETWIDNNKLGQFAVHSTLKKFRMPITFLMSEKGLISFDTYGTDTTRNVDYPGGYQPEAIGEHTHDGLEGDTTHHGAASDPLSGTFYLLVNTLDGLGHGNISNGKTGMVSGQPNDNTVKNIGVIFGRRI